MGREHTYTPIMCRFKKEGDSVLKKGLLRIDILVNMEVKRDLHLMTNHLVIRDLFVVKG